MRYNTKWEPINENTERMRIPQGWLVRTWLDGRDEVTVALCFISDPTKAWTFD